MLLLCQIRILQEKKLTIILYKREGIFIRGIMNDPVGIRTVVPNKVNDKLKCTAQKEDLLLKCWHAEKFKLKILLYLFH